MPDAVPGLLAHLQWPRGRDHREREHRNDANHQQRIEHPERVAEEAKQRRAGKERRVADRGHHGQALGGAAGVICGALLACLEQAGIEVDKDAAISEILAIDAESSAAAGGEPRNPCAISTGFIGAQATTR